MILVPLAQALYFENLRSGSRRFWELGKMLLDKKVAGYFKGQWRGEVDKEMSSRDGGNTCKTGLMGSVCFPEEDGGLL